MCTYIHVYIHTYMHTYTHTCIHTYMLSMEVSKASKKQYRVAKTHRFFVKEPLIIGLLCGKLSIKIYDSTPPCSAPSVELCQHCPCVHKSFIYTHKYKLTYTYTNTHTYIHIYIHTYIHTNTFAQTHTYIHTFIHTSIHTHIHTHSRNGFV